jgi:hypothetical protein
VKRKTLIFSDLKIGDYFIQRSRGIRVLNKKIKKEKNGSNYQDMTNGLKGWFVETESVIGIEPPSKEYLLTSNQNLRLVMKEVEQYLRKQKRRCKMMIKKV